MTYKLNPEIAKIVSPVVLIIDGAEIICEDGAEAAEMTFEKYYVIETISARANAVFICLKENDRINEISWIGEEAVNASFF